MALAAHKASALRKNRMRLKRETGSFMGEPFHRRQCQRSVRAMMVCMARPAVADIGKPEMEGGFNRQLGPGGCMAVQAAVAHALLSPEGGMTGSTTTGQIIVSKDTPNGR